MFVHTYTVPHRLVKASRTRFHKELERNQVNDGLQLPNFPRFPPRSDKGAAFIAGLALDTLNEQIYVRIPASI